LEEGGLEVGHGELSLGVVDHQDEQPNGDECHYNTKFDSAFLEERAGLYSDGLHVLQENSKKGVFNSLAKKSSLVLVVIRRKSCETCRT